MIPQHWSVQQFTHCASGLSIYQHQTPHNFWCIWAPESKPRVHSKVVFLHSEGCGFDPGRQDTARFSYTAALVVKKKVKSAEWLIVCISQIARESIPFPLALDQGDYFASEVEHHICHQPPTLPHRSKPCYSYAELARSSIEPGTLSDALPTELNRPILFPVYF